MGRAQPAAQRPRAPRPRLIEKDEPLADFERAERALLSMMAAQLIPSDLLRVDDFENPLNREIAALLMGGDVYKRQWPRSWVETGSWPD